MVQYKVSVSENILRAIGITTVTKTTDPTSADTAYTIPTLWINSTSGNSYLIVSNDPLAVWIKFDATQIGNSFIDFYDADTAAPVSPTTGDAYILNANTPLDSDWTDIGATNYDFVKYDGSSWVKTTPEVGEISYNETLTDFYIYSGSPNYWTLLSGAVSGLTYTTQGRRPNTSDNTYAVPSMWLDTSADDSYICTDVAGAIATWVKIGSNQLGDAQDSVLSIAVSTSPPPTEVAGDRYILDTSGAPNAAWDGAAQADIVEFDGATWVAYTPTEGTFCEVEDENTVYIFTTAWVKFFQYTGASFATDSGSATPDGTTGVINFVGDATQGISSSGTAQTVTHTIADASTTQKGVQENATDAETLAASATNLGITPANIAALFAAPLALGSGTPAAGTFTTLTANQLIVNSANGMDVNPGSDTDADLITVGVTGSPTISWNETANAFKFNGGAGVVIGEDGDLSHIINGSTVNADLEIHAEDSQDLGGITIHRHSNTEAYGAHVIGLRSNGSHASPTIVTDDDYITRIIAAGYDGTDYALSSEIRQEVDGTPGNDDMPGRIVFLTSQDGGQTPTEALRIDSSQNLTLANALTVSNGGLGGSSLVAYAPVVGGTTTTGAAQSADTGMSNIGYVFTSTGASSKPSWQAPAAASEVNDSTFRIVDTGDTSRKLAYDVGGITTSTTRTWTVPDQNLNFTPTTGDFQASDAGLTDIAGLAVTNSNFIVGDGLNWVAETGATARASMGVTIGSDVQAYDAKLAAIAGMAGTDSTFIVGSGSTFVAENASSARTSMGVAIGSDVQAYDAGLASIAGLTTLADRMIYTTASDTYAVTPITSFGRSLVDDADAGTARSTLGLTIGTNVQAYDAGLQSISGLTTLADRMIYTTASDTYAVTPITSFGRSLVDDATASDARTTLGSAIGSDVQAYDAGLASIAGLTTAADKMIYTTASDTYAVTALTSFGRSLVDDADAGTARATLGLGTIATQAASSVAITGGTINGTTIGASTPSTVAATTASTTGLLTVGTYIKASAMPRFKAYQSSTVANATGNGVTVSPVTFGTEVFDVGSVFATTLFTAPFDCVVSFGFQLRFDQIGAGHTRTIVRLNKNGTTHCNQLTAAYGFADTTGNLRNGFTTDLVLVSGDTVSVGCVVYSSTQTVDLDGTDIASAWFYGTIIAQV